MEVSNRIQDMNKDFRSRLTPQNVKWFFTKYATYTLGGLGCGYAFNQITRTAFLAALGVAVAAVNVYIYIYIYIVSIWSSENGLLFVG